MGLKRSLGLVDLVFMNFVAVVSLRWIASAAAVGPSSLTLWLMAALFFFIPQGLAVAALSSQYPGEGGLYVWTRRALGDRHGFLCGWCYWVNNLVYFPGLLLYVAANLAFAGQWLNPSWAEGESKGFVVTVTLACLWAVGGLSVVGMSAGKWLQNISGLGNWIPAGAVAICGATAFWLYGSANPLPPSAFVPALTGNQFSFFAQLCFALAGLELVSFLGGEIRDPRRNITRAVLVSAVLIVSVYLIGTLGVLLAVPKERITLVNGLILPLQELGQRLGLPWLPGLSAVFIALGGLGCTFAWFSGVARVPRAVGVDKYLPESLSRLHPKWGTPYVSVFVQTLVATAFTVFATAGSETRLEAAYKVLVDMCLILYFIPFCYLFLSLWKLPANGASGTYQIPGGRRGRLAVAATGLITTAFAIFTTVVPLSGGFDFGSLGRVLGGTLFMLILGWLLFLRGQASRIKARGVPEPSLTPKGTLAPDKI